MTVGELTAAQRAYFESGVTRSLSFRKEGLLRLKQLLEKQEEAIYAALKADLGKSKQESYQTEIGIIKQELKEALKHLNRWAAPKKVPTPKILLPGKSRIDREPFGVVLIMSPWNYPFHLCLVPLISALAAGNCVMLKPSAYAPNSSALLAKMLKECFPAEYVTVVEGGRMANTSLLAQKFDFIFFTGSQNVGRTVLEAAAKNLTPVVLELGGKSPCIVEKTADLDLAARRIAFAKGINAGQTCVAPDYVLVQRECKDRLVDLLRQYNHKFYGENPCENEDWPRIINEKHFDRLQGLIAGESVVDGGEYRSDCLKLAPTVLDNVSFDAPVMQEEIFGPVLPVIPYDNLNEAISRIKERGKPLALYLFTEKKETAEWLLNSLSFGCGCVNDALVQLANPHLPFGGIGPSGMGAYHGKKGFDTFSHEKSILKKSAWIDPDLRYPPYSEEKLKAVKKFMK